MLTASVKTYSANIPYKTLIRLHTSAHVPVDPGPNGRIVGWIRPLEGQTVRPSGTNKHELTPSGTVYYDQMNQALLECLSVQPHINIESCEGLSLYHSVRVLSSECISACLYCVRIPLESQGKILPMSQFTGANRSLHVSVQPTSAPEL